MERTRQRAARRTQGARPAGRAARVVRKVLEATAEALGRSGYAGLRVEDVASRSGVNKTTIYRRWPTRAELAQAALTFAAEDTPEPDTGSLRSDLVLEAERTVAAASSPVGQGFVRMIQTERADPEVDALTRVMRNRVTSRRIALVARGIARGELPADTDPELVVTLVFAPLFVRVACHREPIEPELLGRVVDFVLAGARAGGAPKNASGVAPAMSGAAVATGGRTRRSR